MIPTPSERWEAPKRREFHKSQESADDMNIDSINMYAREVTDPATRMNVAVGAIVTDAAGRILLEQRSDNGMWGIPGGMMDVGETILEAGIREVKEETGLDVRITGLLGVYSDPTDGCVVNYPKAPHPWHIITIALIAEIIGGELTISDESLTLRFFEPDALPDEIIPPLLRPVDDFVRGRRNVIR